MRGVFTLALLFLLTSLLQAHVGSPGVYLDAQAGPYELFITVQPPTVIPGVAEIQVRARGAGVRQIEAVPVPLTKTTQVFAPVAEKLNPSSQDAQFFTGSLWMMATGSWQIRLRVSGAQGTGMVAVPVPSIALTTKSMQTGLGLTLFLLMCLLAAGLVLMVGASVREAKLPPGVQPSLENKRRARLAMAVTFLVVFGIVALGHRWWKASEASYRTKVYKPLQMSASVARSGLLTLRMSNPEWMHQPSRKTSQQGAPLFTRVMDDLVPDHNHLMHLYAIREPGLDIVYHLHPELVDTGVFKLQLPAIAAGNYRLYADVVHENGFPETMVAQIAVPGGLPGRPLSGDDAEGAAISWKPGVETTRFTSPNGYTMEWMRPPGALHTREGIEFRFRLLNPHGQPASGMQLYMGMLGHAAFTKVDGSTFAHIHPTGSVPMASYMMAESQLPQDHVAMAAMNMGGPDAETSPALPSDVTFPYGFPAPGQYRIFVQMKHGGTVETGIFDALAVGR